MRELSKASFKRPGYSCLAMAILSLSPPMFQLPLVDTGGSSARTTVESYYGQWLDLLGEKGSLSDEVFSARSDSLIDGLFALDQLAPELLSPEWAVLKNYERTKFIRALRSSIKNKLWSYLEDPASADPPALTAMLDEENEDSATLKYSLLIGGREETLTLRMSRSPEGEWKLADVEYATGSMRVFYEQLSHDLLKKYSFPYLLAELADAPVIILENFEGSTVGKLPLHWSWRARDNAKEKPYRVREEDGNKYIEATDEGQSVILARDIKWDLEEYPYVSFRLRVHKIPKDGDERFDEKVDSAAGIYFIYRRKTFGLIPESVKYVWSTTLPVGSATQRSGKGRPWMVVVGSGRDGLGEWRTYVFDLGEAYRKTFGGKPPSKPIGIGILSDANSTKSQAYADYDDILALKTADEGVTSGVEKILEANKR